MDGFKRPQRRVVRPPVAPAPRPQGAVAPTPQARPLSEQPVTAPQPEQGTPPTESLAFEEVTTLGKKPSSFKKKLLIALAGVVLLIAVAVIGLVSWYTQAIKPADPSDKSTVQLVIKGNTSLNDVADQLKIRGVIKSPLAFVVYARLHGEQDNIKAGSCGLSASESTEDILAKLTAGCQDFKSVIFYPGATINTSLYAKSSAAQSDSPFKDFSITHSLLNAGYSDADVENALSAQYDSPLFADKPAGTSYEGYIFGETYYVDPSATAQEVLKTAFAQMESIVKKDDLVARFKAQGLTLYQGITLASIVEKELDCEGKPTEARKQVCYEYQQKIAQVFLKRYKEGMQLGSDVTFIYAADRAGVTPSVGIDSPYNTRINAGLPPGPIATPGALALRAVANPAFTDYLFFIAGDDGLIYFANTLDEHDANVKNHCAILCSQL